MHNQKIRNVTCLSHDRKQKEINTNVNIYDITVHYITFHVKKNSLINTCYWLLNVTNSNNYRKYVFPVPITPQLKNA